MGEEQNYETRREFQREGITFPVGRIFAASDVGDSLESILRNGWAQPIVVDSTPADAPPAGSPPGAAADVEPAEPDAAEPKTKSSKKK